MKCPNCGCEIEEGHLYCETCGNEIRIVPDFEPEIENSIIETLSTVAEEIGEDHTEKASEGDLGSKDILEKPGKDFQNEDTFMGEISGKNWLPIGIATFLVLLIIIIFTSIFIYHRYSVPYQIEQARKFAAEQNYEEAVDFLERARSLNSGMVDIVLLEADYLYRLGDKERALSVLIELVEKNRLEYEEKEAAFEYIIALYDEMGQYDKINALLVSSEDSEIQNHFQQYMALAPEFGYASGTYEEILPLKISANTTGTIYYTTDGSEPDENSEVYTAPLLLETGEIQISAIFVNDYGIKSQVVRNWYVINLTAPDAPEIIPVSGIYHIPTMIEAQVSLEETVYYTTDGSEPTKDSMKYTAPIFMPLGKSNFKFIAVSEEGVSSEVVSRSYDFALETDVTVDKAIHNVIQALFDRKVLNDLQGHSHGVQGKYVFSYDTIVEIPDLGYYYVLSEYVDDENGTQTKTERMYAVEVYTGKPNRLIYDEQGKMGLISLTD